MKMTNEVFFKLKFLFSGSGGKFSKRAFFFTLFGLLAALYIIGCAPGWLRYNDELGIFILGCNATFGLNYFANEKESFIPMRGAKKKNINSTEGQDGPQ